MTSNPPAQVVSFDKGTKSAFDFDLGRSIPSDLVEEREVPKEESAPEPAPSSTPVTQETTPASTDSIPLQTPGQFVPETGVETKTTTPPSSPSPIAPPAPPAVPATATKAPSSPRTTPPAPTVP